MAPERGGNDSCANKSKSVALSPGSAPIGESQSRRLFFSAASEPLRCEQRSNDLHRIGDHHYRALINVLN